MAEKQYEPTEKRLKKAREEGQTPKSQFLTQTIVLIGIIVAFKALISSVWIDSKIMLEYSLIVGQKSLPESVSAASSIILRVVGGTLLLGAALAVLTEGVQVGWKIDATPLKPKGSRISPVSGAKKIFSNIKVTVIKLLYSLAILAALLFGVYALLKKLPQTLFYDKEGIIRFAADFAGDLILYSALVLIVYAGFEVIFNRKKYRDSVMMSHQEMKDEFKESEGDPQIKALRKAEHEKLLHEEIVARVKKAKVIVVERAE